MLYHRHPRLQMLRLAAALLAVLMLLSIFSLTAAPVEAASNQDKLTDIQKQLEAVRSDRKQLTGQKDTLTGSLALLEERTKEQRAIYEAALEQKEMALMVLEMNQQAAVAAQQSYQEKVDEYEERVAQMYAWNRQSIIGMLLSAESLQGFFTTLRFMKMVTEADEEALEELEAASILATQLADDAEIQLEEMLLLLKEADDAMQEIRSQASMTKAELNKVSYSLEITRQKEAQLGAAASKPPAATAPSGALYVGTAAFIWPIPGHFNITSHFGYRAKYGRYHYGTDISAATGTSVVAMANGTVTFASSGWNDGYGTVIYVDHGNGYQTRYAHLSRLNVRMGQAVKSGQVIGYSGNTGNSSGPHLHFEIRLNGTPNNPMNYFRKK